MAARAIRYLALHASAHLFKGTVYVGMCVRICSGYNADPSLDPTLLASFRGLPFYSVEPLTVLCTGATETSDVYKGKYPESGLCFNYGLEKIQGPQELASTIGACLSIFVLAVCCPRLLSVSLSFCHLRSELLGVTKSLMDGCSSLSPWSLCLCSVHGYTKKLTGRY